MNNLIVGNSSQLTPYFKEYDPNIIGVSSRDFNYSQVKKYEFNRAFLLMISLYF